MHVSPPDGDASVVCIAKTRALVEKQGCRKGPNAPYRGVTCDGWTLGKAIVCIPPDDGDVLVCEADFREQVDDETPCHPARQNG